MDAIGAVRTRETREVEAAGRVASQRHATNRGASSGQADMPAGGETQSRREIRKDTQARLERIANAMDNYVRSAQRDLKIQYNESTGNYAVKVVSSEDGRTIREIPPEELLNLAAKMEAMMGLLFDETA